MSNNHYSRAHRAPQMKASSHRQLHLSFLSASSHRQPCKVIARKLKGVDVARAEKMRRLLPLQRNAKKPATK